jgi:predicted transposase YdaD
MNELTRSHDRIFKKLLSDPERAREYLRAFLPAQVLRLLAVDTLQAEEDPFASD